MSVNKKIAFLTDKRSLYDDRTYYKMALSLQKQGYEVYYFVISDYKEKGTTKDGIRYQIFKRKKYFNNLYINYVVKRMLPFKTEYDELFEVCKEIKADVYQLEDLRLNRITKRLKKLQHQPKLIYDIREPRDNNLKNIRFRHSKIPKVFTNKYADYVQQWEYKMTSFFDHILGVDDGIVRRLGDAKVKTPTSLIYNFTNLTQSRQNIPLSEREFDAAYIGGLSRIRGVVDIAKATVLLKQHKPNIKTLLLGNFYLESTQNEVYNIIKDNGLEENLVHINNVPYEKVSDYYNQTKIGLNPLHDVPAHHEIIQIKLFEYMNYGIPIVTSDFGFMKQYVEENLVGICVTPQSAEDLANSIRELLEDDISLEKFSKNGVQAVDEKYNWQKMEKLYLSLVKNLLGQTK